MIVVAHRGANREAQENSFAAFERAIEVGAQRIELDVVISKDGHGVIVHENSLLRVTGVDKKVSDLTRNDIQKIKLTCGEPVPFLDEVLDRLLPRIDLNVELKSRDNESIRNSVDMMLNHSLRDKIIVSSFYASPLMWISQRKPSLKLACLWGCFDYLDIPNSWANLPPQVMMERCEAQIFHPYGPRVDEHLMDVARHYGWTVVPWYGVHDAEEQCPEREWENLVSLGVDGLCTNFPRELVTWLEEMKQSQAVVNYRSNRLSS